MLTRIYQNIQLEQFKGKRSELFIAVKTNYRTARVAIIRQYIHYTHSNGRWVARLSIRFMTGTFPITIFEPRCPNIRDLNSGKYPSPTWECTTSLTGISTAERGIVSLRLQGFEGLATWKTYNDLDRCSFLALA